MKSAVIMGFLKRLLPLKAKVELDYQTQDIGASHHLKGSARLESEDTFTADEVRLEISVDEVYRHTNNHYNSKTKRWENRTETNTISHYSKKVTISNSFEASKGLVKDFPFEVDVPDYAPSHGGSVTNNVKAVIAVKGRPDLTKNLNYHN